MAVNPIPEGFNTVSVYLIVPNAVEAAEFYKKALGAKQGVHMTMPGSDATMHMELCVGNSIFMLSDENPQWGAKSPATLGGSPTSLHLYVEDTDAAFNRAVEAGCDVEAPLMDAFWGDRYGKLEDPFGIQWGIATHKEDLSGEEMGKRAAEFFSNMGKDCQ